MTKTEMTTEFQSYLAGLGACEEARAWAADRAARQAWDESPRADWLLWWAGKENIDRKLLVRASCACARTALKYVPDGENRPLAAIEAAEKWCEGKATLQEVEAAAWAAQAAAWAVWAAEAARAAAWAAQAAAWAVWAAEAAAWAAWAAEGAAASRAEMCTLIRAIIPFEAVYKCHRAE